MERESKKEAQKKWDRFWIFCAAAVICFLFWVILVRSQTRAVETIQQGIAKEIIRFHVLANSDSEEDQALKMKVKEEVLKTLEVKLEDVSGVDETRKVIQEHLEEIKETAQNTVWEEGYDYPVTVTLGMYEFPTKMYGDCTFPAGMYEALRVCIGKAEGKNWWCVVFPNLCFADSIHAVLPEEEKEELKHVLTEQEYEFLFDGESKIKIRWWWAER
ncbi:MAG: stage II sporulation protein R [Robinsoniella sp.]|nr:stage II sporulation protein R [Robinsoniella sp.]